MNHSKVLGFRVRVGPTRSAFGPTLATLAGPLPLHPKPRVIVIGAL